LRRAAARLERSNRELEEFAYVASHDLQEPLRKIQAFGERLSSLYAPELDERGADYIDRMRAASERMSRLISDLLTYSRVNTQPHPFAPVDLDAIVADVIADLEPAIHDADAEIISQPLPEVHGDAVQLRQLFQNLLSNALKFRRVDVVPRVEISIVEQERSTVTIQVADNGIGFEPAYAERMFRMFERLHGRSVYEGSGIGLAVCQRIVARHDGSITASGSPGHGARFVITLPLHQTTADQASETHAAA
jgi:light-regulated signal transduction histidine kinase (bacteriophytochrome)